MNQRKPYVVQQTSAAGYRGFRGWLHADWTPWPPVVQTSYFTQLKYFLLQALNKVFWEKSFVSTGTKC